jgi:hypothetical protein
MFYSSKNKLHSNRNHSPFTSCAMQPAEQTIPVSRNPLTTQGAVELFDTAKQGNVTLNSLLQVKQVRDARQRSAVDSRRTVKKTSFWLHPLKTAEGLAPTGYNMASPAWAVVQSQRHCVCINAVELFWISAIGKCFIIGCPTFRSPCRIFPKYLSGVVYKIVIENEWINKKLPY